MARKITEDFIGTCQCCFGEFKVNDKSLTVVLHGYQRPGYGYIVGDCEGHGHAPFEYDCSLTKVIIGRHLAAAEDTKLRVYRLQSGIIKSFTRYWQDYDRATRAYVTKSEEMTPESDNWDYYLRREIANAENRVLYHQRVAAHLQAAVDAWKPGQIVGIDVPATGKSYTPRKAYDPAEEDAAKARAAEKAKRDEKPGKLKVILFRKDPTAAMEPGMERYSAHIESTKTWRAEVAAKTKATFEGKTMVREGSDWDLPRAVRDNEKDLDVVIVHLPWEYRDRVAEFYPDAISFEHEPKKMSFTSREV